MRVVLLLLTLTALAGCGDGMTPEEKARADARDVAMVEAAQKRRPPLQSLVPETFTEAEVGKLQPDAACRLLLRDRESDDPVVLAGPVTGQIKQAGRIVTLAADTGSESNATGTYRKYVGRSHWLELGWGAGEGEAGPGGWRRRPGWVVIHDRYDRAVFMAAGEMHCRGAVAKTSPN